MSYSSPYLSSNPPIQNPPTGLSPPPQPQTAPPSFLPRRGYFSSTPQQPPPSQQPIFSSAPHPTFHPPPNSLLTRLPSTTSTPTPNGPEWQAARESVLSQMVTSQDFASPGSVATPTFIATPITPVTPSSRGKPGGRRGRGGRAAKIKIEETDSPQGLTPDFSGSAGGGRGSGRGRGRSNRGGRPRGRGSRGGGLGRGGSRGGGVTGKRKRKVDDEDEEVDRDGSDDSEVYAPLPTQSRSGRRITQVQTPVAVIDLSGDNKPDVVRTPGAGRAAKGPAKKVKRNYRRPGEAAVCKNCGRGHSPQSNKIVFCDGCNTPWHQYCHLDAPIPAEVVEIEDKEWLCGDCGILKAQKREWDKRIGVEGSMGLSERRRYLQGLGAERLVSLLLHATTLHPGLPIFGASAGASDGRVDGEGEVVSAEEELSDLLAERELLPYPKAGQGVRLPADLDALAWVVDEDVGVYSHRCAWTETDLFGVQAGRVGAVGGGLGVGAVGGGLGVGVGA